MNAAIIKEVQERLLTKNNIPAFRAGDNITVSYKIVEGNKTRTQQFKGDVIQTNGNGSSKSFTVRKISDGIGVERVFPFNCPNVEAVVVNKTGDVRRAKLYYMRNLSGKAARIKEKRRV
jgi:large subunit ribosomal protein L19